MRMWHLLRARLRAIVRRSRREDDLAEELRLHVERQTDLWTAQGIEPGEARLRALRQFGAVEAVKEACRDARGTAWIDHVRRDLHHAVRRLARDWRFSAAAVLILGLGVGANTAIFSIVNAALLRPPAYRDIDRLVEIYQNTPNGGPGTNTYPAYLDVAEYTDVFARTMTASVPTGVSYRDRGAIRTGAAEYTTSTYLEVLGLRPSLGRWFDASEDRRGVPVVAVVGHRTWMTHFGADASVIGRTITMQGVPVTLVGVGPADHDSTLNLGLVTDFWLPVSAVPALGGPPRALERRPVEAGFFIKARLRDGMTPAAAQAAMDTLGRRLAAEYPNEDPGKGFTVMASSDVRVHPAMDVVLKAIAALLLGVVGLVLAIASSNLATLLLVRGAARAKEISIRLAVGATRWQLVRQLLTESVLLCGAGGVAGCVVAWWTLRGIGAVELPVSVDVGLDFRVLAFALVLSLAIGVVFGLAPSLSATNVDLLPMLREEGVIRTAGMRRRVTLRNGLVVLQLAMSVVLLSATTLFLQMVAAARAQPPGFDVDGVAILQTDARYSGYQDAQARNVYDGLRRRIAAIPGVESAILIRDQPMEVTGLPLVVERAGAGEVIVGAGAIWAAPGFFETLRIPILFGRGIDEGDREGAPRVAVISEAMARRHFGVRNAVGRRFRIDQDPTWIEVVGVSRDTGTANRQDDLVDPTPELFYRPFAQWNLPPTTVLARTALDARGLVAAMQRELRALDPTLPVFSAETMGRLLERSLRATQGVAALLGGLGMLGLTLAGVGLYAVIAYGVSRRAREIGIRMALGADSRQVALRVARDVARLLGAGAGIGLFMAFVVIMAMRAFSNPAPGIAIYRPSFDPLAVLAIIGVLSAVGLAAAFVPARRAARLDPLATLRQE